VLVSSLFPTVIIDIYFLAIYHAVHVYIGQIYPWKRGLPLRCFGVQRWPLDGDDIGLLLQVSPLYKTSHTLAVARVGVAWDVSTPEFPATINQHGI
jgi:hypothetical protein